jgi:hypothetical protein
MTFDEIITPKEQLECLEALREITIKLYIARVVILMLHDLIDVRFKSLVV